MCSSRGRFHRSQLTLWKTDWALSKSIVAKKWESLCSVGVLTQAFATVSHAGPNSLNHKMSGRNREPSSGTDLQGLHRLRLSMAVNWIAADHVLLGCVSRSNVVSSSWITPLPAAASLTSLSCSASRAAETRVNGRRRRARIEVHNILDLDALTECTRRVW